FVVDKVEDVSPSQLVGHVLEGLYGDAPPEDVPREVLVPELPDDVELYETWLSQRKGTHVGLRVPQRGDKRALQTTVTQNAKEEFVRHRLKRASDHHARARPLHPCQDARGLAEAPHRPE